jgi:hypothetical protein
MGTTFSQWVGFIYSRQANLCKLLLFFFPHNLPRKTAEREE